MDDLLTEACQLLRRIVEAHGIAEAGKAMDDAETFLNRLYDDTLETKRTCEHYPSGACRKCIGTGIEE